jgi:hypothetical protein
MNFTPTSAAVLAELPALVVEVLGDADVLHARPKACLESCYMAALLWPVCRRLSINY